MDPQGIERPQTQSKNVGMVGSRIRYESKRGAQRERSGYRLRICICTVFRPLRRQPGSHSHYYLLGLGSAVYPSTRPLLQRSLQNPSKVGAMDVVKAVETYVSRMISNPNAMKVLLLDSHTVRSPIYCVVDAQLLTIGSRHQSCR